MLGRGIWFLFFHKELCVLAKEVHVNLIFWFFEFVGANVQQDFIVFDLLANRIQRLVTGI